MAPLLVKLQMAIAHGKLSEQEIKQIVSKVPPPDANVQLSPEWQIQQRNGKVVVIGLSPLYTKEGRRQFRAEQAAIRQQIDQLASQAARLTGDLTGLDLTSPEGQDKQRQKTEIDQRLAALKASVRDIGFTGHMD